MVLGQNFGQIMSSVVKKVKKQAISLVFFHILLGDYLLKQEAVVVKPPECKFMAIILMLFFLPDLGNGKKLVIISL